MILVFKLFLVFHPRTFLSPFSLRVTLSLSSPTRVAVPVTVWPWPDPMSSSTATVAAPPVAAPVASDPVLEPGVKAPLAGAGGGAGGEASPLSLAQVVEGIQAVFAEEEGGKPVDKQAAFLDLLR